MYRYLPTLALIVGVLVLAILGAQQAAEPTDGSATAAARRPSSPAPARAEPADPTSRPRSGRRVVRFERMDDAADPVAVVVDPPPIPPAPPDRLTLDDLPPSTREQVHAMALERLDELVERCEGTVPDGARTMAELVLDDRGLHTLDLFAYSSAPGEPLIPAEEPPPAPLVDCLENALWDGDWEPMDRGTSLGFVLSLDLEPAGD